MKPGARARTVLVLLVFASASARHPAASSPADDLRTLPYPIDYGPLDLVQRAAHHRALAAGAVGDPPRRARHLAQACALETLITNDPRMLSASCVEARRLARSTGLLDVQLTLDVMPAEMALKFFDFAPAEQMAARLIERGAALDPASPESRPVRRARLIHGLTLAEIGRYDEANAEFARAESESRRTGDIELLGHAESALPEPAVPGGVRARARDLRPARAQLASSYDVDPDFELSYVGGTLRSEEDDYEGALTDYRHAVTLSALPGGGLLGPVARAMIASLLVHMDRLVEARTELELIDCDAAAGKFFPGLRPLVEHQWGKLERASNRPVDAMRHFAASSRSTEHFISIWRFAARRGRTGSSAI